MPDAASSVTPQCATVGGGRGVPFVGRMRIVTDVVDDVTALARGGSSCRRDGSWRHRRRARSLRNASPRRAVRIRAGDPCVVVHPVLTAFADRVDADVHRAIQREALPARFAVADACEADEGGALRDMLVRERLHRSPCGRVGHTDRTCPQKSGSCGGGEFHSDRSCESSVA